jgi:hypothetical protein
MISGLSSLGGVDMDIEVRSLSTDEKLAQDIQLARAQLIRHQQRTGQLRVVAPTKIFTLMQYRRPESQQKRHWHG